ncbi:Na+/H+ antiporter subunit E [Pontibacter sp. JH31]|uniref:Na+/H+ antiporter subunit E n=1 Tax=Pontibacter aquaedesilientis TaxID=2766980 RepID=A0ABR7XCR1_9BACT|nr:Na+/H+ antiporter subunit E [Pontibacter aquaedesilientis]MBD1396074.1 Na+/H+ antiporter subunit E [Pontibacter aquaedesilientis]
MKTFFVHLLIALISSYVYFKYGDPIFPYNAIWAVVVWSAIMVVLWLTTPLYHKSYFRKLPKAIAFVAYFLKELVVANLKVAYDILTPHYRLQPTVVALPLSVTTDFEITVLAGIITLTPGTLSIDVSSDKKILYVHSLYLKHNDAEQLKQSLKQGFERRLMELTA